MIYVDSGDQTEIGKPVSNIQTKVEDDTTSESSNRTSRKPYTLINLQMSDDANIWQSITKRSRNYMSGLMGC